MNGFIPWFIETIIQEAVVKFGSTHNNKDVNAVPIHFWKWVQEKMSESPHWTPNIEDEGRQLSRDEVVHLVKVRAANQPYNAAKPQQTTWILAKVVNVDGLQPNETVIVSKSGSDWVLKTKNGVTKRLLGATIKDAITSVKDANGPITSTNPDDLWNYKAQTISQSNTVPGRLPPHFMNEYNKKIEDSFLNTNKNIVISALAGTGKTTMLKHLASYKKPGEKWLYLVFNKKNQIEATTPDKNGNRPFPTGVEVLTTHSFLGRLLSNNAKAGKISNSELHAGKGQSPKLAEILDEEWFDNKAKNDLDIPWKRIYTLKLRVKKLASLAKSFAVNPSSQAAMHEIDALIDKYSLDTTLMNEEELQQASDPKDYRDEIVDMTYDVLRKMLPKAGRATDITRDHDDTLWWASLHANELVWPHYNVVLADEVQDFNKNQQIMLKKLSQAGARIIAVGDKKQALYKFRGADNDAFDNIQRDTGGITHMLPINYRSGKNIIDYANRRTLMKEFPEEERLKAGTKHDGEVTENKSYNDIISTIKQEWDDSGGKHLNHETAIIARSNAPLLATAMELLKNGIQFQIVGREFLDEIMKFIKNITGLGKRAVNYQIGEFRDKIADYVREKEEAYKGKIKKKDELEEITTIGNALQGVLGYLEEHNWQDPIDHSHVSDAYSFMDFLRKRFGGLNVQEDTSDSDKFEKNKEKAVTLTTGHRSKGLEFDRVYIIRNDMYDNHKGDTPEDIQQEKHGQYVAYTRAKKQLHVVNDKNPGG